MKVVHKGAGLASLSTKTRQSQQPLTLLHNQDTEGSGAEVLPSTLARHPCVHTPLIVYTCLHTVYLFCLHELGT